MITQWWWHTDSWQWGCDELRWTSFRATINVSEFDHAHGTAKMVSWKRALPALTDGFYFHCSVEAMWRWCGGRWRWQFWWWAVEKMTLLFVFFCCCWWWWWELSTLRITASASFAFVSWNEKQIRSEHKQQQKRYSVLTAPPSRHFHWAAESFHNWAVVLLKK